MTTQDSCAQTAFIFIPPGLKSDRYGIANSRFWWKLTVLELVLGTLVACAAGPPPQALPLHSPELAMSAVPRAREAVEERSFSLLFNVLAETERIASFRFDRPCFKCKDSTLVVGDILPFITPVALSDERAAETRRLLAKKDSFVPVFIKSCTPQRLAMPSGFVLYQSGAVSVFLVFPECQTARLVLESDSPPYFFNVDPIYKEHPRFLEAQPR